MTGNFFKRFLSDIFYLCTSYSLWRHLYDSRELTLNNALAGGRSPWEKSYNASCKNCRESCNEKFQSFFFLQLSLQEYAVFTSRRKAGQHVLLVQGQGGKTFSFLETSVHEPPLWSLWAWRLPYYPEIWSFLCSWHNTLMGLSLETLFPFLDGLHPMMGSQTFA